MLPTTETYETRQVALAEQDAQRKHGDDTAAAARSYGHDVRIMLTNQPEYWDGLGLTRLYARIAFRLAARTLDQE